MNPGMFGSRRVSEEPLVPRLGPGLHPSRRANSNRAVTSMKALYVVLLRVFEATDLWVSIEVAGFCKMVYTRTVVSVLCIMISIACILVPTSAEARILTREDLAPLLAKEVTIPNTAKTPHATPWPEEFTIAFTTDDGAASGVLAYDWGNKQQAIVHGQDSSHCVARGSTGVCYILENSKGTYEVDSVSRTCELTNPGVGTVPPTWVVQGVFAGVEEVNGVQCNRFNYPPTMHAWLETVDGGLPCAFLFPNPSLTYFFNQSTLTLGKPALNIFRVPDYCPQEAGEMSLRADQ